VITRTAGGFLAAGKGNAAAGGTQAVIWRSRDGLTWQRMTAADLGLAGSGEAVPSISYATYRGDDTVIAGAVVAGWAAYSGTWLSTNGGSAWTRVSIPVSTGTGGTWQPTGSLGPAARGSVSSGDQPGRPARAWRTSGGRGS